MSQASPLRELDASIAAYARLVHGALASGLVDDRATAAQRSRLRGEILALKRAIRRAHVHDPAALQLLQDAMQTFRGLNVQWREARGADPECALAPAPAPAVAPASRGNDGVLAAARATATATTRSLHTAMASLTASHEIGAAAAAELTDQEAAMGRVRAGVLVVESEAVVAQHLLTRFLKRLYTDKLLVATACAVTGAVVAIVVLKIYYGA
jgi:hypothetical protein